MRKSFQDQEDFGFRINLDYKKEFARKGEELLASVSFGKSDEEGVQNFDQTFSNPQQFKDLRITDKKQDRKNYNIQLDYSLPFSEDKRFEAGYRSIIRNSEENQYSERFDPAQNLMVTDFGLSNGFDMKDEVHALYSNFQSSLTDNLGFQLGLRLEQAYLHTQYHSLNPADSEVPVKGKIDYLRLYPSFFLTQKFESDQQLQFSYTRRVRRPRGWQVNPFTDISDPMNIRVGNPNLLPEDIHSFELSYAKFWPKITFTSSVYHRRVNDLIESIRTSADNQTSATLSQWLNISSRQATGFEMISKVTFSRNLDVTGNVNVFHNSFKGSKEYDIKPVDGVNWDANLSGNLRLSKNFSMQSRARYNAPSYRAQGKSDGNFVMDTGLKLDVLDSKGSILFNVRDLFNQRKWSGYTETAQFYQDYENRWMSRSFMLTFNYRFGIQNVFNNKKGNGNSDDDFEDGNI